MTGPKLRSFRLVNNDLLGPGCIEKLRNDIATSLVGNDLGTATGSQQLREPCISELVRCGTGGTGKAEMEFPLSEVFGL